ncbi:AI-2E family transporter [Methylocystis heyeri]|nr:AI-2E family transporter [Methylocystis heyeri]
MSGRAERQAVAPRAEEPHFVSLWIALIVGAVVLHELQWILLPFVIAGLVAFLCTPLVDRLGRGKSHGAATVAVFLVIVGALAALGLLGAPPLARELARLVTDMRHTFEILAKSTVGDGNVSLFGQSMNAEQIAQAATDGVRSWIEQPERVLALGGVGFAGLFGMFLTCVLLFYLLLSGRRIMAGLIWLAPPERRPLVAETLRRLDPVLRRYFIGVVIVVIYATLAAYAGLGLMLGIRHAAFLALLTGLLEMVPVVGPAASALIAGLVAIRHATGIGPIIGYAVYVAVLRLSIDQLLGPLVLGVAAQLHPVAIIFAFLAGGALFGIPGVILAAPMFLVVKVSLATWRKEPLPRA